MKVSGKMGLGLEEESRKMGREMPMKAIIKMIRKMVLAIKFGRMVISIKVNGKMEKDMASE